MDDDRPTSTEPADGRVLHGMAGLCALFLICAALYLARAVFAPLAFALLVIALLWPLQRRLQRVVPKLLAMALCIVATVLVFALFSSMFGWAFRGIARFVAADAARLQAFYTQFAGWLEGHDIALAAIWAEHFDVAWLLRAAQGVTAGLQGTLRFAVVVLIYVILGLIEVDDAAARLRGFGNVGLGRYLLASAVRTGAKFRQYMWVRTLMSLATGVLVAGFVALAGLPLAVEWGVLAFVLNYIPFVGSFVATIGPTLFAAAQFATWEMALLTFACLNAIQFAVGSYVEPRVLGSALSISPFLSLFAVFFWSFLWGIPGTFIGVPIVVAILTFCEHDTRSAWVAQLFGATPDATPGETAGSARAG